MRDLKILTAAALAVVLVSAVAVRWWEPVAQPASRVMARETEPSVPERRARRSVVDTRLPLGAAAQDRAIGEHEVVGGDDFRQRMQGAVMQDQYGNYRVEVSTAGFASREYLLSRRPIFYPDQAMLTLGVQGCAVNGYYIELQAQASLLVVGAADERVFSYRCALDRETAGYMLETTVADALLLPSIARLAQSPGGA